MARLRKPPLALGTLFFNSPEQRVLKLLLAEPGTAFTPRLISSKLKGVRGLGGAEGIMKILVDLQRLRLVDFVDNHRAVRLQDEGTTIQLLKIFLAICDLESLKELLEPLSTKGILFGSRATGRARSDSDYDLFVVSESPEEVRHISARHPLGRSVELVVWTPERYEQIATDDPGLMKKLSTGIALWGLNW